VFDVRSRKRLSEVWFGGNTLAWSPSAPLIAGAGYGNTIDVYNADAGGVMKTFKLERKHVQDFAFSADGACLAAVSNEAAVCVWDTRDWSERPSLAWDIGQLKCIAFSPDGTRAACGSNRGTILIWDWD
jgi:WD40 repeat protein